MKATGEGNLSPGQFPVQIDVIQARLQELTQLMGEEESEKRDLATTLLADMQVMLEELRVAQEEILTQNVELASMQSVIEAERQRYQDLFELAPDGYIVTDRDGTILEANPAAGALLDTLPEALLGKPFPNYVLLEDWKELQAKINRLKRNASPSESRISLLEFRLKPRDKEPVFVSVNVAAESSTAGRPDARFRLRWTLRDVTEQKEMLAEIEELRHKLVESREAERLKLAYDIQEGPVQDLYGIFLQLQKSKQSKTEQSTQEDIEHTQHGLEGVIGTLRNLCSELRPPALIPFGLQKAIRSHAKTFQERHKDIIMKLYLMPDGLSLSKETRLALYRVYQEAMSNILRHAKARKIWVNFYLTKDSVNLEIEDDGVGFEVPERWVDLVRDGHYGLAVAHERAEAAGGTLEVISQPGQGTLVHASVERGN